jgi:hypothetical protein
MCLVNHKFNSIENSIQYENLHNVPLQNISLLPDVNGRKTYFSICNERRVKNLYSFNEKCKEGWDIYINNTYPGNVDYSEMFMTDLIFTETLRKHIASKYKELDNGEYICLNYRLQEMYVYDNTIKRYELNYERDVLEYIRRIEMGLNIQKKLILLCTDDQNILNAFKDNPRVKSFGYTNYLTQKGIKISQNTPIHLTDNNISFDISDHERVQYILTDYFLMIFADVLIPSRVGGFGKGAKRVRRYLMETNKQFTLKNMAEWFFQNGIINNNGNI